ncbi:tripartite motif containing 13-like isoform X2 [Gigantopelta aegis]|uniref:tripartite motif containing 13-like isoform X2 n=1 Tax=Gigantopelta aegis TaxID=1735272 RepID=UPI001B88E5A6|nr:tripartite motif containing 13-like isoform X2 [Gigantopelta aegis]XP_041353964.1 tripartite motif containing 13-like isoform X2 [Gigantopelta aegis]XP_041353974.1 tripartite motif containing 13-like isoform X2 [Gigantopelta aegis]
MAAAQESIKVDCQICMLRFSNEARHRPRSLPCGHSLCHDCLGRHIGQTITGTTFQCPFCRTAIQVRHTSQEGYDSLAEQFPVNFLLAETIEHIDNRQIQNTTAQLKTNFDDLKRICQSAEYKMENENHRYLSKLDLSVAQTTADINNAADKQIQEFTAAVRGNQEKMMNRLGVDHESARGRIEEAGKKTKTLLSEM